MSAPLRAIQSAATRARAHRFAAPPADFGVKLCADCEWWSPSFPASCERDQRHCPGSTPACQWFEPGLEVDYTDGVLE